MLPFFAGSFNPFTTGHASIVDRTLALFNGIVIGVGINGDKDSHGCVDDIRAIYRDEPRVKVVVYHGLTAEAARKEGCGVLVRGARSGTDFDYERQLADANRAVFGIDTLIFPTLPNLSWVSSSLVRDLKRHSHPTDRLLP